MATGSPLLVRVRAPLPDAGVDWVEFPEGARPLVAPTEELQVETNQVLRNYRVRIFDESDKALASDDTVDELPDRLRYTVRLMAPLKSGHRYAVVLDAQTGASILDVRGLPLDDQRLEFKVVGDRERTKPAKKKTKAKRQRSH